MDFDGTQIEIGRGAQATVYLYKDAAFKVFKDDYNPDWVRFELQQQRAINTLSLSPVRFEPTEDPLAIKMDYIAGKTLASKMHNENYKNGVEDLLELQMQIHAVRDSAHILPPFVASSIEDISRIPVSDKWKETGRRILEIIPDDECVCHLDFHFLNVMCTQENMYMVIDWINARYGNPLFDFARTYVILHEKAFRCGQKYLTLLKKELKECDIPQEQLDMAIFAMAGGRLAEDNTESTRSLAEEYYAKLPQSLRTEE